MIALGLVAFTGTRCGPERSETGAAGPFEPCTVSSVSDGDTLRCEELDERVRLILIDAPEMTHRSWGDSAKAALLRFAPRGTRLGIEYDAQPIDDFGRYLAYFWLRAAAAAAREAGRGLWAAGGFECVPADFRARRCNSP